MHSNGKLGENVEKTGEERQMCSRAVTADTRLCK